MSTGRMPCDAWQESVPAAKNKKPGAKPGFPIATKERDQGFGAYRSITLYSRPGWLKNSTVR